MKFNFFAIRDFYPTSWSKNDISHAVEYSRNSDPENNGDGLINWDYWANIPNITPETAAYLLYAVNPDVDGDADTPIPRKKTEKDLQNNINRLARWLNGKSAIWNLKRLVDTFGEDNLNTRMVDAVKSVDTLPKVDNRRKLEKQHDAILKVILQKEFDPMKIPTGEKNNIKLTCETDYPLFFHGTTSFENAWKKGRGIKFMMENHCTYAKRADI